MLNFRRRIVRPDETLNIDASVSSADSSSKETNPTQYDSGLIIGQPAEMPFTLAETSANQCKTCLKHLPTNNNAKTYHISNR